MQAILQLAIFVQNNLLNYELLKIIVFSQKRQQKKQTDKIFSSFDRKIALQRAQKHKFT